jgi:hypothetical protein
MYEDIKKIFNGNCLSNRKYLKDFKCNKDGVCKTCMENPPAVNYDELLGYVILGF